MAYPITIVLVILTFFHKLFRGSKRVYGFALFFTGIFSLFEGLQGFGLSLGPVKTFTQALPLASVGLEWVVPALVGIVIGLLFTKWDRHTNTSHSLKTKASEQSL